MIIQSQLRQVSRVNCKPAPWALMNHYGPALGPYYPKRNRGKKWSWPGTRPHPTRMHHYGMLTAPQKAAWSAIAAMMANDHSPEGVTTYNGPIAYMQSNYYRRILGMGYSDTPPSGSPPSASVSANFDASSPNTPPIMVILSP